MNPDTTAAVRRLPAVDALRGFALLGILVVNSTQIMDPYAVEGVREPGAAVVDEVALWLVKAVATAKFYLLFSFLFGYSFTLQEASAERAGAQFTARFLRRSLGLLVLGVAHAVLLYTGDILMAYGLLGLVLLWARRISPRTAVRTACWIYGVFGALLTGLGVLALGVPDESGTDPGRIAAAVAAYRGDPGTVVQANLDQLPDAVLGIVIMAPGILAAFLVGLAAGKRDLLGHHDRTSRSRLIRTTALGLALGVPGAVFYASASQGPLGERWQFLGIAVGMLTAPALSAAYACLVLLLLRSSSGERAVRLLAPAGRMALTNYLAQSVIMTVLATAYGLSLYGRIGTAALMVLVGAVLATQLALSNLWLERFRYGPAEWLLRAVTLARRPRERAGR
ncbi:DUF418 domain-containing protein [Streptomyces sp. YU58]|uniref:DUF418 domain-containing protein n=1 Tax=Streptomyces sp. SX92 TaxID=3158972 RepID=UPI0027BAAC0D|nr:DUF418 domain-containing protein [Streptomyces coralus]WLW53388.1 DUF418 domain-containing protein [Streptomyces coralus]